MKVKALLQLLSDKLSKLWWYLICCKGYYNSKNKSPLLCFLIIRARNAYTCLFCGIEKRKARRAHAFFATSHILWLEGRGKRLLETFVPLSLSRESYRMSDFRESKVSFPPQGKIYSRGALLRHAYLMLHSVWKCPKILIFQVETKQFSKHCDFNSFLWPSTSVFCGRKNRFSR